MEIDISSISDRFFTRKLNAFDTDIILGLCRGNALFYNYNEAQPTAEYVLEDMRITPPGIGAKDKYYFGFFDGDVLIAVMDLIDGYPEPEIAYIGFFMMNAYYQGMGTGTSIITETLEYLRSLGKKSVRLAIDKGNPQSTHFWNKNGFEVIYEADKNGYKKLVAERIL